MMLGLLLARAGVNVVVLEKHGDFLRDFRGDTIHPSTLEVLNELGLLEEFLKLPHQKAYGLSAYIGNTPGPCRGLQPSSDPLQIHGFHSAVGLPEFSRARGGTLSRF
jgi:2-polyprenyl-6-methoxyphenol hydroxylase-like FAD-dependent oxidoreductase